MANPLAPLARLHSTMPMATSRHRDHRPASQPNTGAAIM